MLKPQPTRRWSKQPQPLQYPLLSTQLREKHRRLRIGRSATHTHLAFGCIDVSCTSRAAPLAAEESQAAGGAVDYTALRRLSARNYGATLHAVPPQAAL